MKDDALAMLVLSTAAKIGHHARLIAQPIKRLQVGRHLRERHELQAKSYGDIVGVRHRQPVLADLHVKRNEPQIGAVGQPHALLATAVRLAVDRYVLVSKCSKTRREFTVIEQRREPRVTLATREQDQRLTLATCYVCAGSVHFLEREARFEHQNRLILVQVVDMHVTHYQSSPMKCAIERYTMPWKPHAFGHSPLSRGYSSYADKKLPRRSIISHSSETPASTLRA